MILQPSILALLGASFLSAGMIVYAGWYGAQILRRWDPGSGSERQLALERRTYLVSTLVSYVLAFQVLSLFLLIHTADALHPRFAGAMCAAGTFNVNGYGYPLLLLKIVNFLLAGLWLVVNAADTRGYDFPLIKVKYAMLLAIAPLVLLEAVVQFGYFRGLHADVITSCCGSLFSPDKHGLAGDLAALPALPMEIAFFAAAAATVAIGARALIKGRGVGLYSAASGVTLVVAAAALVSFICLYFYELPTHHCPFCVLQGGYGHVGYPLYAALLGGGVAGLGAGALAPFRSRGSMARVIPPLQRKLVAASLGATLVFTLIVAWRMATSSFRLIG